MTLVRLQPHIHPDFGSRQFRRFFGEADQSCMTPANFELGSYAPKVDVSEDESSLQFVAELPGLKPEEVKVTITDGVLTIRGEKKRNQEQKTKNYHRIERKFGEFVRQFTLPENVGEDVSALFNNGVLEITIAKIEPEKPVEREIKIATGSNSEGKNTDGKNAEGKKIDGTVNVH